jgi:hypothetical protein
MALLVAGTLAVLGCGEQPSPIPKKSSTWYGWTGAATIDPSGDVARLRGKWRRMPLSWETQKEQVESYLVFDGDTVTFDHVGLRAKKLTPGFQRYRFVLNSSVDPKVIRFTHQLGEGEPVRIPPTHGEYNQWYSLEGDVLTMWTIWAEADERPKYSYRRVREAGD